MPSSPFDITMHGSRGELVAVVEVKNLPGLDQALAQQLRQTWLDDGLIPPAPYFLLISQGRGFIWNTRATRPEEFDMASVVRAYGGPNVPHLRGSELELLVLGWLRDLALGATPEGLEAATSVLARTGFLDAIRGARATLDAAA